jgi:hypothetical protein
MNTFDKIKLFCTKFRIIFGLVVLALGFYFVEEGELYNYWFGLGIVPLIAGLTKFCPICLITKKCTI